MCKQISESFTEPEQQNRHTFQLTGSKKTFIKQTITVNFQPVIAIDSASFPQRLKMYSVVPTFNNDLKYYSVAFINPYEGLDQDNKMIQQHQTKVREYSTEITSRKILLPKPRHSILFCCVCKQRYADYLEHIESIRHRKMMCKSKYLNYMNELTAIQMRRQLEMTNKLRRSARTKK